LKTESELRKKDQIDTEKRKLNPHYDLSTEEQIEKLREIHNQLKQANENQAQ
jgi:hypothetical protein